MIRRSLGSLLVALPIATIVLWLVSGRETLTKSARTVSVPVRDELFGDTFVQEKIVHGPIFGYYVGLDLVIVVTLACLVVGIIAWWALRRHARGSTRREVS